MKPVIKLVVFDIAGTTIEDDGAVQQHLFNTLAAFGPEPNMEDVNQLMGHPKPEAISLLLTKYTGHPIGMESNLVMHAHNHFLKSLNQHYATTPKLSAKSGALELFELLKSKSIYIALDTGFGQSTAKIILDRIGWLKSGHVDLLITSDEVEKGRPSPDMIFKAMNYFGILDAAQVVKVGDTKSDLMQGNAAGCSSVIGVTTGAFTKEALLQYPHTHLVSHLMEIPILLGI